ncbi:WD40 repeat domain-containing protein [soil metagenome]
MPTRQNHRTLLLAGAICVTTFALAAGPSSATTARVTAASSEAAGSSVDRVLKDDRIVESSGLANSTYDRRVIFTHNDSGDTPRFYAVGASGNTRGTFTLRGASALDWEDMSPGPNHHLWLGDIGDNGSARNHITLYRVREPRDLSSRKIGYTRFHFVYPDGAHDAESLMVRPTNGRVFIVTKSSSGHVYRAPRTLSSSSVNKLRRVGPAPDVATGSSWFPGRSRYVVRTYTSAYIYSSFDGTPRKVTLPSQRQGESIDAPNRTTLLAGTEGPNSPVHRVTLGD